ncbi:MAG: HK97 family phage prohead protease, partial [Firmicutes bacterium]|nr:HK97 family phage prohead protease [Bacillota bacterium]
MGAIRSRNWPLAPRDRAWDADAAGDRVRRWAGGPAKENIDWDKFRSCHLWYDEDDPENFGSYKLLYVDVIDGEPHVVFRALAAIIAVLNGARGGVDIPAADREKVYAEAAKQYRRFDEEPPELKRGLGLEIERRTVPFVEVRLEVPDGGGQPVIRGYAAVFDSPSEHLGSFREIIRRGAFARSIKEGDVRALWNHDSNYVLGRTKNGTLKLKEDIHGLAVEILPPDTQFARDFVESIRRGDVDQMSFGFRAVRDNWYTSDGETLRELVDVELYDVSPTAFPAYPQTSVTVRTVLA